MAKAQGWEENNLKRSKGEEKPPDTEKSVNRLLHVNEHGGTMLISSWNIYCLKAHPV